MNADVKNKNKNKINDMKGTSTMTKTFKKMISVIVTVVMIMTMGVSALAADPLTITITKRDTTDKSAHSYEIYQVFSGQVSDDGKLYNIGWGTGINTTDEDALIAAINTKLGTTCATVADVVNAVKAMESHSESLDNFAKAISPFLSSTKKTAALAAGGTSTSVEVSDPGYYMVKDTITSGGTTNARPSSVSKFMLKVLADTSIEVNTKEEIPTLDKIIESDTAATSHITADGKKNTASVGDDITYRLTTAIPDLRGKGYTGRYCFVVNDVLSAGLTYKGTAAPTITIATSPVTTLVAGTDFTFTKTVNDDKTTSLQIVFDSVKMLAKGISDDFAGKAMTITYTATLNADAVVTTAGNPNTANLVYSNDPNQTYSGDIPTGSEPHGETPDSQTITYTTQVQLVKVDQANHNLTLAGAKLRLTGLSSNKVVTTAQRFIVDANGTYWKLKDGTYTTKAPETGVDDDKYDSLTTKYKLDYETITETKPTDTDMIIEVGEDGRIDLSRLGEGTYKLLETEAPEGYVTSSTEHTLVITCDLSGTDPVWKYVFDTDDITATPISIMIVDNMKTSDLPITGGMGTTYFYIAGSVLVLAGVTIALAKRKYSEG